MKLQPSTVAGVDLIGPGTAEFNAALESLLGREPDEILQPALPYSVIAHNGTARAVALLGVRFDMTGKNGKPYSVVHYADTLRYPERAALTPGAYRFVCAEPLYTDLVLRKATDIDRRGPMNLANLRTVLRIAASVDTVAFDDGRFEGPDSLGAFDRFRVERQAEMELVAEVLSSAGGIEDLLGAAMDAGAAGDRALLARRVLAKKLHTALAAGGADEVAECARKHRLRISLRRGAAT